MGASQVRILREAVVDLMNARAFFEKRQTGMGAIFSGSIMGDLERLTFYAGIHVKKSGFHRMLAKRFPYAIYYRVKDRTAEVVAILPMRRDPEWIRGQLDGR